MERRLLIAILLSVAVILIYPYIMPAQKVAAPEQSKKAEAFAPNPIGQKEQIVETASKYPFAEEKEEIVETGLYRVVFSNLGGSIKRLEIKEKNGMPPPRFIDIQKPHDYLFLMSDPDGKYIFDATTYAMKRTADQVEFTANFDGITVTKKYSFNKENKFGILLDVSLSNVSDSQKGLSYAILSASGIHEVDADKRFVELKAKSNGKISVCKNPKDKKIAVVGNVDWVALKNRYYGLIVKPLSPTNAYFYRESGSGYLVSGIESGALAIAPYSTMEQKYFIYAGPLQADILKSYNIGIEDTKANGFFGGLINFIMSVMAFFYKIFKNWGVAIICLSICLNVVLYPLTLVSMKSMKKMQSIGPKIEKIKTQYKDNAQKVNQEVMELYKKEKINPFGGCLPLIAQMPIFIALYQGLMMAYELKGSGFLWMNDLSAPDAIVIPFTLPLIGNHINILLILMVIAMVIQQKMSSVSMGSTMSEEQKQQQKIMLIMMPILFGFIFYNMPSGLVLYWFINTIITIGEQYFIFRHF